MPELDQHYMVPELIALYDDLIPRGQDYDFYINLAKRLQAVSIADLGCGTGLLTRELCLPGRRITGVDPAQTMLNYARKQSASEPVSWLCGNASVLATDAYDLALMTGNVAQVFIDDADWHHVLNNLHRAINTGGSLSFESRNPALGEWQQWTRELSHRTTDTTAGLLDSWVQFEAHAASRVSFTHHYVLRDTDRSWAVRSTIVFRSKDEIVSALINSRFTVQHVFGDWSGAPYSSDSRVLVFVATKQ